MSTLPDPDTDTDRETNKKCVKRNCVEVFTLPDTDADSIGLHTHLVGVSVGIGVGQCEHTIRRKNHHCTKFVLGNYIDTSNLVFILGEMREIEQVFYISNSHKTSRFAVRGLDEGGQSVPFANRAQSSGMQDITRCCQTCTGT